MLENRTDNIFQKYQAMDYLQAETIIDRHINVYAWRNVGSAQYKLFLHAKRKNQPVLNSLLSTELVGPPVGVAEGISRPLMMSFSFFVVSCKMNNPAMLDSEHNFADPPTRFIPKPVPGTASLGIYVQLDYG